MTKEILIKSLRYGLKSKERPGSLDSENRIRDLSSLLPDITSQTLSPEGLAALCAVDITGLPEVNAPVQFGIPYNSPGKIICVGLNYRDHTAETGQAVPDEPVLFLKAMSPLTGPNDPARNLAIRRAYPAGVRMGYGFVGLNMWRHLSLGVLVWRLSNDI